MRRFRERTFGADDSSAMDALILECLAKNPADRPNQQQSSTNVSRDVTGPRDARGAHAWWNFTASP